MKFPLDRLSVSLRTSFAFEGSIALGANAPPGAQKTEQVLGQFRGDDFNPKYQ